MKSKPVEPVEEEYEYEMEDGIPQLNAANLGNDPNKPTKSRKDYGNYEYEESTEEEDEKAGDLFKVSVNPLDPLGVKKKDDNADKLE